MASPQQTSARPSAFTSPAQIAVTFDAPLLGRLPLNSEGPEITWPAVAVVTVPVGIETTPVRLGEWAVLDLPQLGPTHVGGIAVAVGDAPVPAVVVRDLVGVG